MRPAPVQHDAHDIDLLVVHLLGELAHAAQYAEQHDEAEDHRQRGFQHARAQLVAPGSGEVAHPVDVAFAVAPHEEGQPQVQRRDRRGKPRRHPLGHAARQHGAENARHHAQHDGEEGTFCTNCISVVLSLHHKRDAVDIQRVVAAVEAHGEREHQRRHAHADHDARQHQARGNGVDVVLGGDDTVGQDGGGAVLDIATEVSSR